MAKQVKIIDRGWNKLQKKAFKLKNGKAAAVGFQGSKGELASEAHAGLSNIELAAIHEFGTIDGRIPERPMIRNTFDQNKDKYAKEMKKVARDFYAGREIDGDLLLAGEQHRTDIMRKVKAGQFEEWAESTKKRKEAQGRAGDKPLWVTSQLINSLTVEVVDAQKKRAA